MNYDRTPFLSTCIYVTCFMLAFTFLTTDLTAGNLSNLKLIFPVGSVTWGDETDVEVEGRNINSKFSVTGINGKLSMWRVSDNFLVYEQEEQIDEVKPNTDFSINYGPLKWDKLEFGLSYRLNLEFTADFDEDPSDNTLEFEFAVDEETGVDFETNNIFIENYPNPFTDYITIKIHLENASDVSLDIIDIQGSIVKSVAKGEYVDGLHYLLFDGSQLANGLYFARLKVNDKIKMIKLIRAE